MSYTQLRADSEKNTKTRLVISSDAQDVFFNVTTNYTRVFSNNSTDHSIEEGSDVS